MANRRLLVAIVTTALLQLQSQSAEAFAPLNNNGNGNGMHSWRISPYPYPYASTGTGTGTDIVVNTALRSTMEDTREKTKGSKNKAKAKAKAKGFGKQKQHHTKAKTYKEIKDVRRMQKEIENKISSPHHDSGGSSGSDNKKKEPSPEVQVSNFNSNPSKSKSKSEKSKKLETNSVIDNNEQKQQQQQQQQLDDDAYEEEQMKKTENHLNEMKKRLHNIHSIRSSRTGKEKKRSSDRLTKAQSLLKDFEGVGTGKNGKNTSAQKKQQQQQPTNDKKAKEEEVDGNRSVDGDGDGDASADNNPTEVPDTFWYNGNLQQGSGDYVTRWARGVKVAEPLRKYDPIGTEKTLFRQPTKWIVRNIQIAFPLALWAVGVATDVIGGNEERNRRNRAVQLLQTISGLGPAIIKGGQALASRSDLLPAVYLAELQKLQDDVPRFDNNVAFATVEEELGMKFDDIFELMGIEDSDGNVKVEVGEPIAAASIGQVYKARLRSNGRLVAIKIQRPRCEEVIALDLYVLRWWSGVANALTKLLDRDINVQSIIDDFGELIYRELDYVAEAANAQRFSELYGGVEGVFVPKVYSELTTSKVLTMEWIEGFRLTDVESLDRLGLDRKKLVDTLVQCSLRQILGNGFFHADPHGGNLLVVDDGRLCYLDFGMMSYAESKQRNGFLLAVVHIVNRDWDELVKMYQRLGFIPEELKDEELKPIAVALENSLPDALNADISELNFKNVVGKLGDIMYTYSFSLPPFYIAIIRCLGVLEGLAIQVDPQARILSEAYPYVASRVLTDPQDELQEALRRLALTSDGNIRWNRLERLLSEAKGTKEYDVSVAVNQLTNYLISDDGEQLLIDMTTQIVEGADALGSETMGYIVEASRALIINDEVAAARAFTALNEVISAGVEDAQSAPDKLRENLETVLPEPTPSMLQFLRISTLLGARGSSSDPSKLIPIVRRLSQEPKIQRSAREIMARLGERVLSRSLRAFFGLPP